MRWMGPIRLHIEGTSSSGSAETLETALRMVPGVIGVRIAPGTSDVIVEASDNVRSDDLIAAALKAGYVVTLAG